MNPCGQVVDVLRSCRTSSIVLTPGEPAVPIRWYFTPPGALWLGVPCAFTAATWDAEHVLGPPPIGEQDPPYGYDLGKNTGQYSGKCGVGIAEEWLDGPGPPPAVPRPLPDCCQAQPGLRFYLRSDLAPTPPNLPAGFVCPWANRFDPVGVQVALSPEPGSAPQMTDFVVHGPLPVPGEDLGRGQYISPPLGPGLLSARTWTVAHGYRLTQRSLPITALSYRVAVALCDSSGALRSVVLEPTLIGVLHAVLGDYHTALLTFAPGPLRFGYGDYLVVELGIHLAAGPGGVLASGQWWDSGNIPITATDVGKYSPASFLDFR